MKLALEISLAVATAVLLALFPVRGRSEQVQQFDQFQVHYNALSSDMLPAEVARQYQFTRSSKQGLVNIAVQKLDGTPVSARITGTAATLAGQRSTLALREIRETDAVYYLGEFPVRGRDTVSFHLDITPDGSTRSYTLKFSKNYVTD